MARRPAVVMTHRQAYPALVPLAVYEGLAGLTLRLRIELLLEPLLGRLASIDRTSDGSVRRAVGCWPRHRPASGKEARARLVTPKNRGPDQCAPVICSAITVSDRWRGPRTRTRPARTRTVWVCPRHWLCRTGLQHDAGIEGKTAFLELSSQGLQATSQREAGGPRRALAAD